MPSVFRFGLSTKVTKKKAENIRERYNREALRKKQKLENCIINIDDADIDFGGLGVGGDTVKDGDNVPLLELPPSEYCIARCFLSNNLTSPADDSEKLCWGENLLGDDIECENLEDPDGYYKALGCKKISSDEDIGVALKKAKKGFFGIGRNHHPDKTEDKEKIELFKKAREQYKLQKTAFETIGTLNLMVNAYANRVIYNTKGGELRSKFLDTGCCATGCRVTG